MMRATSVADTGAAAAGGLLDLRKIDPAYQGRDTVRRPSVSLLWRLSRRTVGSVHRDLRPRRTAPVGGDMAIGAASGAVGCLWHRVRVPRR